MTPLLPVAEEELHAYMDGQLAHERRGAVEQWLAAHPQDSARVAAYRLLAEQWRAAYAYLLAEPIPQDMLRALQTVSRPRRRLAVAIAAGVILGALGVWQLPQWWHAASTSAAAAEMVHRAAIAP